MSDAESERAGLAVPEAPPLPRSRIWAEIGVMLTLLLLPALYEFIRLQVYVSEDRSLLALIPCASLAAPVGWILIALCLMRSAGEPLRKFGIGKPKAIVVLGGGAALCAAAVIAQLLVVHIFSRTRLPQLPALTISMNEGPVVVLWAVLVISVMALAEEVVFRAHLGTRFRQLFPDHPFCTLLLPALCFSFAHSGQPAVGFAVTFTVGLILGAAFVRLRSIWPGVLAHAAYNAWIVFLH